MFEEYLNRFSFEEINDQIESKKEKDVLRALNTNTPDLDTFQALISPVAQKYIKWLIQKSRQITLKNFGNTIQLYIPMYLSNECQNICTYCGFSFDNRIPRKTLTEKEILQEIKYLKQLGYNYILLVTGESDKKVGVDYISKAVRLVKPYFSQVAIEVQPLEQEEYEHLIKQGVDTVLVYQETYNRGMYKEFHPKGRKSNFDYRLATPERLGKAGVDKMGLGVLLGLSNWRADSFFTALHLSYLYKRFWKSAYSISFPRLRPYEGQKFKILNFENINLIQLICSYRILFNHLDISISTRESKKLRNQLISFGTTLLSAESKTVPGGYVINKNKQELEQFEISDDRSTLEIQKEIIKQGYQPVMKNWQTFK